MHSIVSFVSSPVVAVDMSSPGPLPIMLTHLFAVVVYSMVGMLVLGSCFLIMKRLLPFSVTKEIEQDQNIALAIIIASVVIGMSIIIAAAII